MHPRSVAILLAGALGLAPHPAAPSGQEVRPTVAVPPLVLDLAVVGADGRAVADLVPPSLSVRVDGRPRRVLSIRPAPPSSRLVVLAIDETSYPPTLDKNVRAVASRVVSGLGPEARVALLALPLPSPRISFTNDRAALGAEIERVSGKAAVDLQAAEAVDEGARPPVDPQTEGRGGRGEADTRVGQRQPQPESVSPSGSFAPLQRVLLNLRNTPGPKTVLFLSAAPAPRSGSAAPDPSPWLLPLINAAIAARAVVDGVVLPAQAGASGHAAWIDELASSTGGLIVDARRDADAAARALAEKLRGSYVAEVECEAADRDNRSHAVSASSADERGRVFAPARIVAGAPAGAPAPSVTAAPTAASVPSPAAAAAPAPPAAATPSPAAPAPRSTRNAPAPRDAETDALLVRAAGYLAEYEKELSSVVAEEDYVQRHNRALSVIAPGNLGAASGSGVDVSIRERRLKSDFLLVRAANTPGWVPFRDVFEVDGKGVRDREDRLRKLFLEAPAAAFDQARRIMLESARYNLGDVPRTINTPTLPLMLVDPRHRDRFNWKRQGEQTVEGVRTRRVEFEEREHPTLVRTSRGDNVAITGTLWIDPASGRVVKGSVTAGTLWIDPATGRVLRESVSRRQARGGVVEMTVLYKPNSSLGLWVPAEMTEFYQYPGQTIDATAKYSNFRRFQVKTEETITLPKK